MYLVFENANPNAVRSFKELSEQQLQAIMDTEDYTVIHVEATMTEHRLVANLVMEDTTEEVVQGGSFRQSGSVVQVV